MLITHYYEEKADRLDCDSPTEDSIHVQRNKLDVGGKWLWLSW